MGLAVSVAIPSGPPTPPRLEGFAVYAMGRPLPSSNMEPDRGSLEHHSDHSPCKGIPRQLVGWYIRFTEYADDTRDVLLEHDASRFPATSLAVGMVRGRKTENCR